MGWKIIKSKNKIKDFDKIIIYNKVKYIFI